MRTILVLLLTLFAAVGAAWLLQSAARSGFDPGYVIAGWGRWSIEASLVVWLILMLLGAIVLSLLWAVLFGVLQLPQRFRRHKKIRLSRRSQKAFIQAMISSAEGKSAEAEDILIQHATNSGVPLMHYLTAARAAHARGAIEEREAYLQMAYDAQPDAAFAVGLVHAELQLSHEQFEEALENLARLHQVAPRHSAVLKLLHQAYAKVDDWESVRRLIPELHARRILMEAEIKLLEIDTYSGLLRQKAQGHNAGELQTFWQSMPYHIRRLSGVRNLYYAAMIEAGAGTQIEAELRQSLGEEWDPAQVVLFANIAMPDAAQQLAHAEGWLAAHPQDAILLRMLGRIALRAERLDVAELYLRQSLGVEPSVEAYELLGSLWMARGDALQAADCYRRGLALASGALIQQVTEQSLAAVAPAHAME